MSGQFWVTESQEPPSAPTWLTLILLLLCRRNTLLSWPPPCFLPPHAPQMLLSKRSLSPSISPVPPLPSSQDLSWERLFLPGSILQGTLSLSQPLFLPDPCVHPLARRKHDGRLSSSLTDSIQPVLLEPALPPQEAPFTQM